VVASAGVAVAVAVAVGSWLDSVGGGGASLPRREGAAHEQDEDPCDDDQPACDAAHPGGCRVIPG
jgi:hypothetical protein